MKNNNQKEYDILCIGSCVQDILIEGMTPECFQNSVTILKSAVFTCGGDAANEAVVLSRLGSKTALLAKVDASSVGNTLFEELKKEGVETGYLVQDSESRSTTAFVVLNKRDHNFFVAKGENEGISEKEIDLSLLKKTRAVCIGSLYTTYKLNGGGAFRIMKAAKESGVITFADLDYDIENIGPNAMDKLMPYMDYLLPSIEEARYITGAKREQDAALYLLNKGAKKVVIKLGNQGCYVRSKDQEFYVDPYIVEARDTTGCGDNFVAGFIHSVLSGKTLRESATFACATGALNALEIGGHMAVKSSIQIESFMQAVKQQKMER